MSQINALGFGSVGQPVPDGPKTTYLMRLSALRRVFALRKRTIDDVVNNPIVKNEILGYWKVLKTIDRHEEIRDLERQWNSLGRRL